ncbi:hypothetical protein [Pseudoalteromonas sp. B160]|uniref:hypothetical protein n=1 Tax=Pseudoalteromonas sp. B160 TaxID=630414 RepID=UPI00301B7DFA
MRTIVRILSVVALGIAGTWLYFDRSFEPALTTVVSLSALITSFFLGSPKSHEKQSQKLGDGSTGIQAGGNVNISMGERENKEL